ncbi:MAG: DUF5698 domain-containing protein [Anaerolineales bacterium]|jgi:uncharacterized protein YebE (UPF0316 family)|nr:DUF5698 domain-containing protein [Anaerolineales bacterium]
MEINWFEWFGLPLIIFTARVVDVTLGTIRIIFISRGKRHLAPLLGFVEVFIWVAVISQITRTASGFPAYFAYAAGFAVGNYVGMKTEDRLALGKVVVRMILSQDGEQVAHALRESGFGATVVAGEGANGGVKLIYTIVNRRDLAAATTIIHQIHPRAFLSIEEVRSSQEGVFPDSKSRALRGSWMKLKK